MYLKTYKKYFLLWGLLIFILGCSSMDDGDKEPSDSISFVSFEALDRENLGNGADVYINYSIASDVSLIKELRLLVSKTTISIEEAIQVTNPNYGVLTISESNQEMLSKNLSDIEGNLVNEDINYYVYILGILKDSEASPELSPVAELMLVNEIAVTTPKLSGSFFAMEDIVIDSEGTLYVNGGGINQDLLYKVTKDGESSVLNNKMNFGVGITLDDEGNIYTSSFTSTVIKKITPEGEATDFVVDTRLVGGGGLTFDANGNLFNCFYSSTKLFKITAGLVEEYTTSTLFNGPVGITYVQEQDKLYVSSFNDGKIFEIGSDSSIKEIADTPASIGHLSYADGYFYVTGYIENKVYKVSLEGVVAATIGTGAFSELDGTADKATFSQPNGIEVTPDGKYVYVTQGSGTLRKIILEREN
ncbi:hypothetical protein [Ascidiimonas sp. W6]|uniref:hypothetical protein n=1 Tax=Ascidiimonas meishanensis TaxID=3128903 RepID=UPI0030EC50B4